MLGSSALLITVQRQKNSVVLMVKVCASNPSFRGNEKNFTCCVQLRNFLINNYSL